MKRMGYIWCLLAQEVSSGPPLPCGCNLVIQNPKIYVVWDSEKIEMIQLQSISNFAWRQIGWDRWFRADWWILDLLILSFWSMSCFRNHILRLGTLKRSKYAHFIDSVILSKSYSTSEHVSRQIITNVSKTLSEIDMFADSLFKHKIFCCLNPALNFRVTTLRIFLGSKKTIQN